MTWACPDCGREFANRNQWHSCGVYTVKDHLGDKTGAIVALYDRIVTAARRCGDVHVEPVKTLIELKAETTFAAVKVRSRWVDLALMMPDVPGSGRIRKVFEYGPEAYEITIRLSATADVDEEIESWLCRAYHASEERVGR